MTRTVVSMAKVDSRDSDHWCTTEDVRDIEHIPSKGSERDFEQAIERATNLVQSKYRTETGNSTVPDAGNLDDLLVEATAWYAASESTYSFSRNFSNEGGQTGRVRTAEQKAEERFQQWLKEHELTTSEAETEGEVVDVSSRRGTLIDEF